MRCGQGSQVFLCCKSPACASENPKGVLGNDAKGHPARERRVRPGSLKAARAPNLPGKVRFLPNAKATRPPGHAQRSGRLWGATVALQPHGQVKGAPTQQSGHCTPLPVVLFLTPNSQLEKNLYPPKGNTRPNAFRSWLDTKESGQESLRTHQRVGLSPTPPV